jgi:hypothetical protein
MQVFVRVPRQGDASCAPSVGQQLAALLELAGQRVDLSPLLGPGVGDVVACLDEMSESMRASYAEQAAN